MKTKLTAFQKKVYSEVSKIPRGKTKTYKEIAEELGTSARAVAKVLACNPKPIKIPCHRVIKSNGNPGGYTFKGKRKDELKKRLLQKEGAI